MSTPPPATARPFDRGMQAGLLLVVAVLVVGSVLTLSNVRNLYGDARWVQHTHEVIGRLEEAQRTIVDAETGLRGYLVTGDPSYLAPYNEAVAQVQSRLDVLQELMRDNRAQRDRLFALRVAVQSVTSSMRALHDKRQANNFDPVREKPQLDSAKSDVDSLRRQIAAMKDAEFALLENRALESEMSWRSAVLTSIAVGLAGLLMTGSFAVLTYRSMLTRVHDAAVIYRERELFQVTLASIGDGVIATDTEGRVTFVNHVAEDLTGWSNAEAQGKNLLDVFRIVSEETRTTVENPALRALEEGLIVGLANHTVLVAQDGTERAIADSAAPIRDPAGQVLGAVLVFRDVTDDREFEVEREQLFEAAENERRRLEAVLEALPAGVIIADADGRLTHFNKALYKIWGRSTPLSETIDQYSEWKGWWPKTGKRVEAHEWAMARAIKTGQPVLSEEVEIERFDGGKAVILNMASPILDRDGRVLGGVVAELDLTERKQAEVRDALLGRVEDAMRPLSNPLEITQAAARLLGIHLQANRCAYADVEIDQDTFNLIGDYNNGVQSIVGRYTFSQFGEECLRLMRAGEPYVVEDSETDPRCEATLSSYRLTQIRSVVCVPILKDGQFVAAMAMHQTTPRYWQVDEIELVQTFADRCWESIERARVERTLRESEKRFRTLADNIAQFAWMADREGWMSWFNRRWFEYTGTTLDDVRGWGWRDVIHPDHIDRVVDKMCLHWRTGEVWEDVFPLRSATGEYRWFLSRAVPIRNEEGRVTHWFGTNTDITDRKKLEDHLREVAADLSEANRRKNEFLATLAHELRNPLAPIRTGLELLRMAADDQQMIAETRNMMERQTQQMVRLIDDLLDVSRITQGKIQLRRCRVELADVVRNSVEATQPFIAESGHQLSVSLPSDPIYLHADPNRLAQIFSNLLNNAAKYTKEGGRISLLARIEHGEAVVSVRDNGLGIPFEQQERIFEMFAQIDRSLERGFAGLGIGLTLVKRLVEMHGGSIEVESDGPNRGSTFTVRLPMLSDAPSSEMSFNLPASTRPTPYRILVVDDNKSAAESLGSMLKIMGHEIRTAYDGQEAVDAARSFRPNLILMDLGMPKLNGYEAAAQIRQEEWGRSMALVALTGWGQEEDKVRTRAAGFDDHLTKPAEPAALQDLLAMLERSSRP